MRNLRKPWFEALVVTLLTWSLVPLEVTVLWSLECWEHSWLPASRWALLHWWSRCAAGEHLLGTGEDWCLHPAVAGTPRPPGTSLPTQHTTDTGPGTSVTRHLVTVLPRSLCIHRLQQLMCDVVYLVIFSKSMFFWTQKCPDSLQSVCTRQWNYEDIT